MKVAVSIHSPTGAQEPNLATLTSFMNAAKQFAIMEIKIQLMMSALMALIPHAVITQNSKLAHLPLGEPVCQEECCTEPAAFCPDHHCHDDCCEYTPGH